MFRRLMFKHKMRLVVLPMVQLWQVSRPDLQLCVTRAHLQIIRLFGIIAMVFRLVHILDGLAQVAAPVFRALQVLLLLPALAVLLPVALFLARQLPVYVMLVHPVA